MRLRPFILCFYRTAITTQKSGLKSSVFRSKPFPRISPKSYRCNAVPNSFSSRFSTSLTNAPRLFSRVKAGTHSAFSERSHTRAYTAKQGPSERGRYHYPRSVPHVLETLRGQMSERQTLPLFGLGRVCSRRTQKACGTAMRLCALLSRRCRGPAGLRDLFSFLSKLRLVCPVPDTSFGSPDAPACAVPVQAASQLVPFWLGVQWFSVETGRIFCYNFGKRVT